LVLAIIALVGVSMAPLISTAFRAGQPSGVPVTQTQQKIEEAAKGYEVVLQREPENQAALRGLVEARIQLLDLNGTVAPLEKLVALNPAETQYGLLLAEVQQRLGDREGEAAAYRSILAANPGNLQALEGLANVQLREQRPEEAVTLLQNTLSNAPQANQNQPGSVDVNGVRLLLAQVYATQQNYEQAIAIYDELISNDKQDFRPVLAKAMALQQQGKNEEAKPLFDSATALAPDQYKERINQLATPTPSPIPSPLAPDVIPSPTPSPSN
jgi:tetratricopeptide (TPR) repeat protein